MRLRFGGSVRRHVALFFSSHALLTRISDISICFLLPMASDREDALADCKVGRDKQQFDQLSVDQTGNVADVETPEARKVRWKIDCVLLPLLGVCYMLQFLDKQTLSYASLLGILEDVNLVDSQFSWTASIFYFGFIFWSYPTVYLSVRLPIGKYLSCTV